MIADLKPYPAMKDSGVPWLGEVPEHWEARKLRHVLIQVTGRNRPDLPLLSVVREKGVILRDTKSKDENHNFIPDDLSNYKVVRVGQFAMNKMKAWQGSYGVSHYDGIVSPAYFVFDVIGVDGGFFHTAIRSKTYIPFFTQASDGVRIGQWDLVESRMKEIPFLIPPLPEQRAIVRFLDHVDRRIRRSIRAKRKLIALLNEQKQAVINCAVTRGLDPNVRLKPSGVEWLGDVPEHWEVIALRRVTTSRCDGPFGSGLKSTHYVDSGVRVIRLQNIGYAQFKNADAAYISEEHYAKLGDHSVITGDLLIAGLGDEKIPPGRACIAPEGIEPAMVKADCFRFRLDPRRVQASFAALQLTSTALAAASVLSSGATRQRINLQSMSSRPIILPPLLEQSAIVRYLDEVTTTIDHAISATQREIDLLKEYRTRLIADVVTGKLDVRAAAADLPDEAEEAEPIDEADEPDEADDEICEEDGEE